MQPWPYTTDWTLRLFCTVYNTLSPRPLVWDLKHFNVNAWVTSFFSGWAHTRFASPHYYEYSKELPSLAWGEQVGTWLVLIHPLGRQHSTLLLLNPHPSTATVILNNEAHLFARSLAKQHTNQRKVGHHAILAVRGYKTLIFWFTFFIPRSYYLKEIIASHIEYGDLASVVRWWTDFGMPYRSWFLSALPFDR